MAVTLLLPLLALLMIEPQQSPPPALSFERLTSSAPAPPPASSAGVQELVVVWRAFALPPNELRTKDSAPPPINQFEVSQKRLLSGPLPIDRNPELSAEQLVVAGADVNGSVLSWALVKDPRIVRSEQPGPDGTLSGTVLYRGTTDLLLMLPDSPEIVQVGVYQPRWTGAEWALDLIGAFPITR
jgi:hypothetical protein